MNQAARLKISCEWARRLLLIGYLAVIFAGAATVIIGSSVISLSMKTDPQATALRNDLDEPLDVLFFGDSVLFSHGVCDNGTETVPESMAARTDLTIHSLSHGGYGPVMFREHVRLLSRAEHQPSMILVGVNLRNYSDAWHGERLLGFDRRRAVLSWMRGDRGWTPVKHELNGRYGFALANAASDLRRITPTQHEVISPQLLQRNLECYTPEEVQPLNTAMGRLLDYHYGLSPTPDHPVLTALEDLIDDAATLSIPVVVYITPINVEDIEKHALASTGEAVRQSVEVVTTALAQRGVPVFDLHDALPAARFVDKGWACEHLDQTGRHWLAEMLVAAIEPIAGHAPFASHGLVEEAP